MGSGKGRLSNVGRERLCVVGKGRVGSGKGHLCRVGSEKIVCGRERSCGVGKGSIVSSLLRSDRTSPRDSFTSDSSPFGMPPRSL